VILLSIRRPYETYRDFSNQDFSGRAKLILPGGVLEGRSIEADLPGRSIPVPSRLRIVAVSVLSSVVFLAGCSNSLNPFCGSSRPAPLISSLSPSTLTFTQVQQGTTLTIAGSNFVPSTEVVINGKTLGATAISSTQLQLLLNTDVISAPGTVDVKVMTPSGNTGDLGCSSGGTSSVLVLTVK
jgi:hypothetical protein